MEESSPKSNWWKGLRANRNDEYQLVIRDVKSYRELQQYNLTPLNIYIGVSTVVITLFILMFLLIAFTPLRSYIPGYGDVVQRQEMTEMEQMMEEMAEMLEGQSLYIDNLRKTIHGEATTSADVEAISQLVDTSEVEVVPVSEDEVRLRREVDLDRVGQTSRQTGNLIPSPGSTNIPLAQLYLLAPVNGEISAGFDLTSNHRGVDIIAPKNTPIKACRDGVVFTSEFTSDNGHVIGIQHDNNLISFYKHNSQLLKDVGERVKAGEAIAIVGNTGTLTTGPHLHFELWHEGEVVDPVGFLRF